MDRPTTSIANRILSITDSALELCYSLKLNTLSSPISYVLPSLLGCQVPNKPSSISYSMSARRKVGAPSEDLSKSPGPGNSTNPDVYRKRQPSFSMQSRTKRPVYSSAAPGPGTYSPERFHMHLRKAPSFTLGARHSEFITPLVVDVND